MHGLNIKMNKLVGVNGGYFCDYSDWAGEYDT
jgi:hypothetical protein